MVKGPDGKKKSRKRNKEIKNNGRQKGNRDQARTQKKGTKHGRKIIERKKAV